MANVAKHRAPKGAIRAAFAAIQPLLTLSHCAQLHSVKGNAASSFPQSTENFGESEVKMFAKYDFGVI